MDIPLTFGVEVAIVFGVILQMDMIKNEMYGMNIMKNIISIKKNMIIKENKIL